ncbi:molybdopterin-dependent oxidoreductase [Cohnella soli]|uniref:Molybdopterin-dependent oxidoreductase n=1 Tax=Cohnella soli TaxID=425005 RepID=A0ABW0HUH0_9BACL
MARKPSVGKQLAELHRWNGWIVLLLAVTGLLLAWEEVRGWLNGYFRNPVKQLHIVLGVMSAILIALYVPLVRKHLKQIRNRPRQKGNLGFVMALLVGWLLSGIVLWQIRRFPPGWANAALVMHDLLTYIGVPYIVYHSVARLRWMKQPHRKAIRMTDNEGEADFGIAPSSPYNEPAPLLNRKQFLKASLGVGLAIVAAPPFFRWLSTLGGTGLSDVPGGMKEVSEETNRMLPNPTPMPDSVNVVGGGARGYFRVYTVTPLPSFESTTWLFTIDGLVERPATWNWEQFLALKRAVQVSDFHCVTGWSVYDNTWEGIPLSALLQTAGVKRDAKYVKLYSGDGEYTDSLTLEQANMDDVMVAVLHDGKPIHRDYGGPARLIVPKMYAYKSVKWLNRIELIDKEHTGYWEKRGYDTDAWV